MVQSNDEGRAVISIEDEGSKSEILTTRTDFCQGQKVLASIRPENIHTSKPDESLQGEAKPDFLFEIFKKGGLLEHLRQTVLGKE